MKRMMAALALAAGFSAPATAGADPTPPPAPPGYQIAGQFPGAQVYPPRCLEAMRSCGFEYSPDDGTWHAPPPSD
jgi:hypothetical protein